MAATFGPNDPNAVPASLDGYFETDQYNLDQNRRLRPEFAALVPIMYQLYDQSTSLLPRSTDRMPPDAYLMMGNAILLCYKAMLAAAGAIGRGHPDDAGPITRRAVEIATTVAAIKHDPANLEAWRATEKRLARWKARREGERPRSFSPAIKWPTDQSLIDDLRRILGTLSDAVVHFTPEYESGQGWQHEINGDRAEVFLPFHSSDEREIVRELLVLASIHSKILRLFDWCLEGVLSLDATWKALLLRLLNAGGTLGDRYLSELQAPTE